MKRSHRHELKQNEFLVWFEELSTWFVENRRNLLTGGLTIVLGVSLIGGFTYYRDSRNQESQRLLDEALRLFHGRVRESSVVQSASGPEFASHEERYRQSLTAFQQVIDRYPSMRQGRQARYYAAVCHRALEQYQEAENLLDELDGGDRDLLYYLGARTMAAVKTDRGDPKGAIEIYRRLAEDPKNPLPKDQILMELAEANEKAGDLEEARRTYANILDEYPDSLLRAEIQQRSDLIAYRLDH